jgi:hypothetical protein
LPARAGSIMPMPGGGDGSMMDQPIDGDGVSSARQNKARAVNNLSMQR